MCCFGGPTSGISVYMLERLSMSALGQATFRVFSVSYENLIVSAYSFFSVLYSLWFFHVLSMAECLTSQIGVSFDLSWTCGFLPTIRVARLSFGVPYFSSDGICTRGDAI